LFGDLRTLTSVPAGAGVSMIDHAEWGAPPPTASCVVAPSVLRCTLPMWLVRQLAMADAGRCEVNDIRLSVGEEPQAVRAAPMTIAEVTCRSAAARVGKKRRMADGRRFIGVGDRRSANEN
jgi:hypothetical protein